MGLHTSNLEPKRTLAFLAAATLVQANLLALVQKEAELYTVEAMELLYYVLVRTAQDFPQASVN